MDKRGPSDFVWGGVGGVVGGRGGRGGGGGGGCGRRLLWPVFDDAGGEI